MAIERYFEEAAAHNYLSGEGKNSLENWKNSPDALTGSDESPMGTFDCNICLDFVQDPVVTLCGHLYCWPCIYKWLHFQTIATENQDQNQQQCPVCKAEVSHDTLIPLYGKGPTTKASSDKAPHFGLVIPKRPLGPACGVGTPSSPNTTTNTPQFARQFHHRSYSYQPPTYYPQQGGYPTSPVLSSDGVTINAMDPVTRIFGEMVYARVFGNSVTNLYSTYPNSYHLAGSTSPRIRRHVMQADKSLNRISFFLFCCIVLCLLLF